MKPGWPQTVMAIFATLTFVFLVGGYFVSASNTRNTKQWEGIRENSLHLAALVPEIKHLTTLMDRLGKQIDNHAQLQHNR